MSLNMKLNELSFENIGSWPFAAKAVAWSLWGLLVIIAVYFFDTSYQIDTLNTSQRKEVELRQVFEKKYYQSASLNEYKKQLTEMRVSLGNMLHQLPSREEVPSLLEDISKSGRTSGLEFKLFDPSTEIQHDFYAELPIEIIVDGDYHQFGDFVGRIAALGRIVTLHDIDIKMERKPNDSTKTNDKDNDVGKANNLVMKMTAKTYRYSEEEKQDNGKKDDGKTKKIARTSKQV